MISGIDTRNWFKKHLNWTFFVTAGLAAGLREVSAFIFIYVFNAEPVLGSGIGFLVGLILVGFICSWILRQKNRDVLWLLILIVPFGWVTFLLLENRSSGLPDIKKELLK